jgi:hypothetical protein
MNPEKLYVIFFSSDHFVSKLIKTFEKIFKKNVKVSHVGLLFHSKHIENKSLFCSGNWLVLESTLGGELNDGVKTTCNKTEFGVQLRSFSDIIETKFYTSIIISSVQNLNLNEKKREFNDLIQKYHGTKYERNPLNLFLVNIPFIPSFKNKYFFCSEFVWLFINELLKLDFVKKKSKKISPNTIFFEFRYLSEPIFIES